MQLVRKIKSTLIIIFICVATLAANAFEAANPYWLAIKPKVKDYLNKNLDLKKYSYTIQGPTRDLKTFLGNRQGLDIKFSKINLTSPSMRKIIMATAYDEQGQKLGALPIAVDIKIYKKVLTLKNSISKGQEITASNITEKVIAIDPRDERIYFDGRLAQKVAARTMRAGTAIKINQVRHEKLIQVGDSLRVTNKNKMIVLEFMCKAMKSGDLGDVITVHCENLQSKTQKAKIVSESHAEFI